MKFLNYIAMMSIFLIVLLAGCDLETAKAAKKQEIIIASDFLNHRDLKLFESFEKEFKVKVTILTMDTDSLMLKLDKEGYATRIDVLMLKSALDMCKLKKNNRIQKILNKEDRPDLPKRYCDEDFKWFGLSIDPYIIVSPKDSNRRIINYGDLAKQPFWTTNLTENKELIPLFTSTTHQWRDQEYDRMESWHSDLLDKEIPFRKPKDSIPVLSPLLTTYSSFYSDSSLYRSGYKRAKLIYPNQNKSGLIYELRGVAIVKQARNYSNSVDFINYLFRDDVNQRINNWWNTFPINTSLARSYTYQNKRFKSYHARISELCSFQEKAERLLNKNRRK